ncbi:MAG: alpha/beta hydrolase [Candidatus Peregrinibacteria bacterium]|nr:alpha/beta hydrolase [Candidatus Peregrinibacteria bacterium]
MPPNTIDSVALTDGRSIEYAEYGDPKGKNIIFFHGLIGSYHQASPAHEAAKNHGFRLIAPNRAGVGHSSPNETKTIVERMDDIRELLEKLNVEDFGVVGLSGGSPYALAAAHVFETRVKTVAAISGMGTIADLNLLQRMEPSRRRTLQLAKFPFLANLYLSWRMRGYAKNPEVFLDSLIQRWPKADQELFKNPALRSMFLGDLDHTLHLGSGTKGLSQELRRYFHWGFDPQTIEQQVHLWHGTDDHIVPPVMSEYMAERLPNSEVSLHPGGHSMIVNIIGDVMRKAGENFKDTNS